MDNQKAKLQEYQVTRANDIDETSALMQEKQRKRVAAEAKKRNAGHKSIFTDHYIRRANVDE